VLCTEFPILVEFERDRVRLLVRAPNRTSATSGRALEIQELAAAAEGFDRRSKPMGRTVQLVDDLGGELE